jgi:catechol 2,3-dioxygenase-like lactoylglutathione lyase family enzyme
VYYDIISQGRRWSITHKKKGNSRMSKEDSQDIELCQISLVVRDIEETAGKWAEVFGLKAPEITLTDGPELAHTSYKGKPTDARAKLAFFQFGPISVELIEPVGGPSTWQEFLDKNGPGLHHIGLTSKNAEKMTSKLENMGIDILQQGDFTGGRYTYFDSGPALGAILELLEFFK